MRTNLAASKRAINLSIVIALVCSLISIVAVPEKAHATPAYNIGDVGPGGGRIFYYSATGFNCGPTVSALCNYLEAAPSGWNTVSDPLRLFANNNLSPTTVQDSAIGTGYKNSLAIIAAGYSDAATYAAKLSRDYSGGGKSDWYLPSKDELNQMCKWTRGITGTDLTTLSTVCTDGIINTGVGATGFSDAIDDKGDANPSNDEEIGYWSSTNGSNNYVAWWQSFRTGNQSTSGYQAVNRLVRPIRAFNSNPIFDFQATNYNDGQWTNSGTIGGSVTRSATSGTSNPGKGSSPDSVRFNGSENGYQFITTTQYKNPQSYSFNVWFKTSTAGGKLVGFEGVGNGTGCDPAFDRMLYIGDNGKLYFQITSVVAPIVSASAVNDGSWRNAVAIYTNNTMTLYLNGILVGNQTTTGSFGDYEGYWRIGGCGGKDWFANFGDNGYFNGDIGQVSIYDRGLTSSEVTANYSNTRVPYQGLTPTFGTTTATSDGFTVQITNYDAAYTWAGTATASGSVSISGNLVTVTGVAAGTSSTATITTTRTGYPGATATVTATSITGNALTPTFGTPTATADGFTVQITNYDAAYTWAPPTVSTGSVAVTSTVGSNRLLTVTGLAPGASATITATTTRSGYNNGSATVVGTASTGAALTPTFGTPTTTANGFSVQISNYDAAFTWAGTATASGSVSISGNLVTVTGVAPSTSSTATITTSRTGYTGGSATVSGTSASNISTLSGLTLSSGTLSPTFTSSRLSYTATVATDTSTVTVTPTRSEANATITVNGTTVASGSPSGSISLNVGANTITVIGTAQDGTTTTYTITVRRAGGTPAITIGTTNFMPRVATNVGVVLTGFDETLSYQATVKFVNADNVDVSNGTLAATRGSTTLISGYTSYSSAKLGFKGTYAQIAAALASMTWNPATAAADIRMRIGISTVPGTNEFYDANSGRYYRFVPAPTSWTQARTNAEATTLFGLRGYLAEITSAAENAFVANETSAFNIWIGATEDAVTAVGTDGKGGWTGTSYNGSAGQRWIWNGAVETPLPVGTGAIAQGSAAAFSAWRSVGTIEPNNDAKPGADCGVTNWGARGVWNDRPCSVAYSYLIEFGGRPGESSSAIGATLTTAVSAGTAVQYTITYNPNSGNTTPTQASLTTGQTFNLANAITRNDSGGTSYQFAGWRSGSIIYKAGDPITVGTANLAYTAVWVQLYEVTYVVNGGSFSGSDTVNDSECTAGANRCTNNQTITLNAAPTRAGYTFDGWKDQSGAAIVDTNSGVDGVQTIVTSTNYIFTATWTPITYTITYVSSGSTAPTQSALREGQSFTVATAPTRTGFEFTGWNDGTFTFLPDSDFTVATSNITLTAQWSALYTVTYSQGLGSGTPATEPASYSESSELIIATDAGISRSGFTFAGWNDGTTTYQPGASYTVATSNVTLTAQWTATRVLQPGLLSTFSTPVGLTNSFIVQVTNFNPAFDYSVWGTAGNVAIDSTGLITVRDLSTNQSSTLFVTTSRDGFETFTESISGRALEEITPPITLSLVSITPPSTGSVPILLIPSNGQFTGSISWSGSPSTFGGLTVYIATATLTPVAGFSLNGVSANFFSVSGATSVTHDANSGVITVLFPVTGKIIIGLAPIGGVTAPIRGATPATSVIATNEYTGTISWTSGSGRLSGNFAASTVYTATITLTAHPSYTFSGVKSNFFTIAGATSVTHDANSNVITAVFPATVVAPPAFSLSSSSEIVTAGSVIMGYTINSTGGAIASYSISPAISNTPGLTFSTLTGLISGIPIVAASSMTYTITAINATSPSASNTFAIAVRELLPSILKTISNPKISRDERGYYCQIGKFIFYRESRVEETPKLSTQVFSLLSNGKVIDSIKSNLDKVFFTKSDTHLESTLTCQVDVGQENSMATSHSLNSTEISAFASARKSAIEAADFKFFEDREDAYAKKNKEFVRLTAVRSAAVLASKSSREVSMASSNYQKAIRASSELWKKELADAATNRAFAKELAQKIYLESLESAGISIYPTPVKVVVTPTPSPTPTPKPTPTPTPTPVVDNNPQPTAQMVKVGTVYMASGSYSLNDATKITLKAIALKIKASDATSVLVYGHTDSRGGVNNTVLSQNRAKAVANFLRPLLKGKKISVGWYASRKPVAVGNSAADLAKNRRVEVYAR